MFLTPTLRNVATRRVFFHNGVFHSLQQVLDFYNFRDVRPAGLSADAGRRADEVQRHPGAISRQIVDMVDAPFDRILGAPPAMTARDEADIIAFLRTLTDGYQPSPR